MKIAKPFTADEIESIVASRKKGVPIGQIADRMFVRKSRVRRVIDEMIAAGRLPPDRIKEEGKCYHGHDRATYGVYSNGYCKECKRIKNAEKAIVLAKRRAAATKFAKPKTSGNAPRTGKEEQWSAARVDLVLAMRVKLETLPHWERGEFMKQIEAVEKGEVA